MMRAVQAAFTLQPHLVRKKMMTPEMADIPMNFSRSLHDKSECFQAQLCLRCRVLLSGTPFCSAAAGPEATCDLWTELHGRTALPRLSVVQQPL